MPVRGELVWSGCYEMDGIPSNTTGWIRIKSRHLVKSCHSSLALNFRVSAPNVLSDLQLLSDNELSSLSPYHYPSSPQFPSRSPADRLDWRFLSSHKIYRFNSRRSVSVSKNLPSWTLFQFSWECYSSHSVFRTTSLHDSSRCTQQYLLKFMCVASIDYSTRALTWEARYRLMQVLRSTQAQQTRETYFQAGTATPNVHVCTVHQ